MNIEKGTLIAGEPHPACYIARVYIEQNMTPDVIEAFSSCAIEGNRMAEISMVTWNRLQNKEPVSDRYLMGLAWSVFEIKSNISSL